MKGRPIAAVFQVSRAVGALAMVHSKTLQRLAIGGVLLRRVSTMHGNSTCTTIMAKSTGPMAIRSMGLVFVASGIYPDFSSGFCLFYPLSI